MIVALATFLIVLLLLLLPIKLKGKLTYNLFENQGHICLFLFGIKLYLAKCKLGLNNFKLRTKSKKTTIYFNNFKNQTSLIDIYFSNLVKAIKLKNIRFYANFGFNDDQLVSCVGSAVINIFFKIIGCFLSSKKPADNLNVKVFTSANRTCFIACVTASIQLNLMLIIICFIKSLIRKINLSFKKVEKNKL